jgi:nitroimidazol reductase NimA-like FMN-containing flavoprotein (pyridoxamine 5'-phosphate oxidase superfamily)
LAYAYEGQPYIVPIHFGYDGENIYFFTTDGTKTRILSANPKVCLQVEQVEDFEHWQSVMVIGHAEPLSNSKEIDRAIVCLTEREIPLPPEMNKVSLASRARR